MRVDPNEPREIHSPYTLQDFDYALPPELVAQHPLKERASCRLLVCDRKAETLSDSTFDRVADYFAAGDALVLNDTRVMPAKLAGKKPTGGKVDLLLLRPDDAEKKVWCVLAQPTLKEGQRISLAGDRLLGTVKGRNREGLLRVEFDTPNAAQIAQETGQMPLPPYIRRPVTAEDAGDYQTVYARNLGAVAAPTAGLHFTETLLDEIRRKQVQVEAVTLHVGYGTFKPVTDLTTHRMHVEHFELSADTAQRIQAVHDRGAKVWAVGTTSVRVLETCVQKGVLIPGRGETDLFLYPPAKFEIVRGLITNFHLPKSTLLMLVSAFMGHEFMKKAYRHAVKQKYRFYSYGDAMIIL